MHSSSLEDNHSALVSLVRRRNCSSYSKIINMSRPWTGVEMASARRVKRIETFGSSATIILWDDGKQSSRLRVNSNASQSKDPLKIMAFRERARLSGEAHLRLCAWFRKFSAAVYWQCFRYSIGYSAFLWVESCMVYSFWSFLKLTWEMTPGYVVCRPHDASFGTRSWDPGLAISEKKAHEAE